MGLDMYVYTTKEEIDAEVDFDVEEDELLHQWRKHPNLHGWMRCLYESKGGSNPEFNCVNLMLTRDDLDFLESSITAGALPTTYGFFFGESDGTQTPGDLQFVIKAREAIDSGLKVFYRAWW